MSEEHNDREYGESFWNDVDSLRAFLEEEEKEDAENSPFSFDVRDDDSAGDEFEQETEAQPELENSGNPDVSVRRVSPGKRANTGKKPSGGLLAVLYFVIVLEIAAIAGVGVSWYLWIH